MNEELKHMIDILIEMLGEDNLGMIIATLLDCLNKFVGNEKEKDLHTIEIVLNDFFRDKYDFDKGLETPKA